jgi:exopolysaccharide biosynthesis polyprenyl glycosylphosphotransferase
LNGRGRAAEGIAESRVKATEARDSTSRRLLALADMSAALIALTFSAIVLGDDSLTLGTLAVPFLFVGVAKALGLYDRDEHLLHKTTLDEVPSLFGIATLVALLLWLSDGLLIDGELGRRQVIGTWGLLFFLLICFRSVSRWAAVRLSPAERCILVGDAELAAELRWKFGVSRSVNAELVGYLPTVEPPDGGTLSIDFADRLSLEGIDRVILTIDEETGEDHLFLIRALRAEGFRVSVVPEASRVAGSAVELDHLHGLTLLGVRRFEFTRSSRFVKRSFDIALSSLGLVLLSPVLMTIATAIKLDSRGPVLFKQRRVGRWGTEFEMFKFRSMVEGADEMKIELSHLNEGADGLFKIGGDPRVTRMGRLLRRWQLDELPQLINVLKGEMSLVGPRPLIPEEDRKIVGWYRRRLEVPPGITGHWQILGSSSQISLTEMVKLDYLYVATWSLWTDVKLLLRTIPFLLGRGGV